MADWVLPYQGVLDVRRGTKAKCRVRIYEDDSYPEEGEPVVVLTELPSNQGESIVSASEVIAGTLLNVLGEILDPSDSRAPMFLCHYPPEITGSRDAYELVSFGELVLGEVVIEHEGRNGEAAETDYPGIESSYRVIPTVGEATYRPVDVEMVQMLLGSQL